MEIDPRQNFIEFALHVIDHLGLPHPDVPTDGGGALEFGLNVDGLATVITYEPEIQPEHVLLECRVGPISGELNAATNLLASNARVLIHGGPTWGLDAETREVTCSAMLAVRGTHASSLADNIRSLARWARMWSQRAGSEFAEFSRNWELVPLTEPAQDDRRATFGDALSRIRASHGVQPLNETALAAGGRRVWVSLDGAALALTHGLATDEFFTACVVGDPLDGALAGGVTESLLEANRLSLQEAGLVFGLDAQRRRLLCRLTAMMPCRDIDGLLDGMRLAFDGISNCDTSDDAQGQMPSLLMSSLPFLRP